MILEEAGYIKTGRMSTHILKKEFTEARVADIMIEINEDGDARPGCVVSEGKEIRHRRNYDQNRERYI